ncbi:hypothetical protein AAZX31_09G090300 [Glycine max]
MAGGGSFTTGTGSKERAKQYKGRVTAFVIISCIVAAIGGVLFGYDIGISGGVTSMDDFLIEFFPSIYRQKKHAHENNYCKYDNQGLAAFTSSLYIVGLVASLMASPVTRKYGRRASIIGGGISFLIGSALNASAINLIMLILGQVMLGVGIGFGNQAIPLYLSKMAPTHLRGGLNMMFQVATTFGIFTANMINFGTQKIKPWCWRLSLGLAAVPLANSIKHPFRNILERRYRPELVMVIFMPTFQIPTGINSILLYAPVLFQSMGFGGDASLISPALTVLASSTFISLVTLDRFGRRVLLVNGGVQMITCQIIVAIILGVKFGTDQELSKDFSILVVVVICLFVTVPSEIFPLEIRSAGQGITVAVNLFFTFIIASAFLALLCSFKFGIFFFFAGWITIMTIFVYLFLLETKGIPIEEMSFMWRKHWFWKRICLPIDEIEDRYQRFNSCPLLNQK